MFGEDAIFGQSELNIDSKGRIFIPINTKREVGEDLVLLYNKNLNLYEIYSIKKLEERFEEITRRINNATTKKEKIHYQKFLYELSKSILRREKVDAQGRVLTGKIFEGYDKVKTTGAYDHLIVEPIKMKK